MTIDTSALLEEFRRRKLTSDEAAATEMLSRWVSELEPSLAYNQEWTLIGLSHGGEIQITRLDPQDVFQMPDGTVQISPGSSL